MSLALKGPGDDPSAVACPYADWTDKKVNLYVPDWDCGGSGNTPGVQEFNRGARTPSFAYTAGLSDPVSVETDKHGNADAADYYGGYLDEYKQSSNTIVQQCALPSGYGLVASAAIDPNGSVFMVSINDQAPSIGSQISVPSNPFSVTINKKSDRVYTSKRG